MEKLTTPMNGRGGDSVACTSHSTLHHHLHNTDLDAQRIRLADYLRENLRITTIEAREKLNILHPAGRVKELREQGLNIITIRRSDTDAQGKKHNVAEYVLLPGKWKGGRKDGM